MSARPRLLAVHAGAIGDLIVAMPALARMAAAGNLTVMGRGERIALVPHAIAGVHTLDIESAQFHTVFSEPSHALRTAVRGFDAALVWFRDGDGVIARGLRAAGVAKVLAAPGAPLSGWEAHASDYYHATVENLFQQAGLNIPELPRAPYALLQFEPESPPCDVIIHPGSGSATKNWPLEHFAALAQRLEKKGFRAAWLRGPAEDDWDLPGNRPTLSERNLTSIGRWFKAARLFIGNDSGMAHLAAACGCPTLALFVSSDPQVWAPRGPRVMVIGMHDKPPTLDEVEGWGRQWLDTARA